MITYDLSVSLSFIAITLISIKLYGRLEKKLHKFQKYLPKITGVILIMLAIMYLLKVFLK